MTSLLGRSVARIKAQDGSVVGAGFLLSKNQIVTCAHVIADAVSFSAYSLEPPSGTVIVDFPLLAANSQFEGKTIFWQPIDQRNKGDIAVLEIIENSILDASPLDFIIADDLWGHTFRVFGFPSAQDDGVWASGRILDKQATGWIQIEDIKETGYRVQSGFSGSAIWDEVLQGVVGMAVAAEKQIDVKAAFIIPVTIILEAIKNTQLVALPTVKESDRRFTHTFSNINTRIDPSKQLAAPLTIAIAIVQRDDEILMVRRRKKEGKLVWQFPAGIVKPVDDPEETVIAEVKGETGITCKIITNIGQRIHPDTGVLSNYYYCAYLHGKARNLDKNENAEVAWVKAADVVNYVTSNLYIKITELLKSIEENNR